MFDRADQLAISHELKTLSPQARAEELNSPAHDLLVASSTKKHNLQILGASGSGNVHPPINRRY